MECEDRSLRGAIFLFVRSTRFWVGMDTVLVLGADGVAEFFAAVFARVGMGMWGAIQIVWKWV
jgi:hypothetical protein